MVFTFIFLLTLKCRIYTTWKSHSCTMSESKTTSG